MATKTIDLQLKLDTKNTDAGANKAVANLKRIQDQANKTRESMAKLTEVGGKMALLGAGILAPLTLAMNKYVSTMKDTEPASKRIAELSKKWEESQVRLGRVTAEIVLPALEKGAAMLEKVITFAEKNPGVVQAALTIGTTLVVLGGLIATTAQLVSTVATIQGLAAAAGLAMGGGGAAAGVAGAGAVAAGGGLTAAIVAAAPFIATAMAVMLAANMTLWIMNGLLGTNQTWADILTTVRNLGTLFKEGVRATGQDIKLAIYTALGSILKAFATMGAWIANAISGLGKWFKGGKADGGYVGSGLYRTGEQGREFILSNQTTRNAERAIGGQLTQAGAMTYMTNNMQIGNGMTIAQTRRMIRDNETQITNRLLGAFT
jgi:hypothetical protein